MALEILRDPRLADVDWKDLLSLSRGEVVYEVLLSLPWLVVSLVLAHLALTWPLLWIPALGCSFTFFLCGLRQVHNAFHYAVGIAPRGHEWLMYGLSVLMLSAMHAVQFNHLRHHRALGAEQQPHDPAVEVAEAPLSYGRFDLLL